MGCHMYFPKRKGPASTMGVTRFALRSPQYPHVFEILPSYLLYCDGWNPGGMSLLYLSGPAVVASCYR